MKRLFIGIGSQRAGSTLLYKILDECTNIFMNPVKELHYFDTLFDVRGQNTLKIFSKNQFDRCMSKLIDSDDYSFVDERFKTDIRTNYILHTRSVRDIDYFDLYRPNLNRYDFLGEVTPEYMLLDDEGVCRIREKCGDAVIFLIGRDPVERMVSAFKLRRAYGKVDYSFHGLSDEIFNEINDNTAWIRQQLDFNKYDAAVERFRRHFSDVVYLSYESLLESPESELKKLLVDPRIELDLDYVTRILTKKVNSFSGEDDVGVEAKKMIKAYLEIGQS